MADPTFVTPRLGPGGVIIRSAPQIDSATKVGLLNEGARLELDAPGADGHTAKVCVVIQPDYYGGLPQGVFNGFKALQTV